MGTVQRLKALDAFARLEAETVAAQSGIENEFAENGGTPVGVDVSDINDGDWSEHSQVNFREGASSFHARTTLAAAASEPRCWPR